MKQVVLGLVQNLQWRAAVTCVHYSWLLRLHNPLIKKQSWNTLILINLKKPWTWSVSNWVAIGASRLMCFSKVHVSCFWSVRRDEYISQNMASLQEGLYHQCNKMLWFMPLPLQFLCTNSLIQKNCYVFVFRCTDWNNHCPFCHLSNDLRYTCFSPYMKTFVSSSVSIILVCDKKPVWL